METEIDKQTGDWKQIDRQTGKCKHRWTGRQASVNIEIDKQTVEWKQSYRQANSNWKPRNRQEDRRIEAQKYTSR